MRVERELDLEISGSWGRFGLEQIRRKIVQGR